MIEFEKLTIKLIPRVDADIRHLQQSGVLGFGNSWSGKCADIFIGNAFAGSDDKFVVHGSECLHVGLTQIGQAGYESSVSYGYGRSGGFFQTSLHPGMISTNFQLQCIPVRCMYQKYILLHGVPKEKKIV